MPFCQPASCVQNFPALQSVDIVSARRILLEQYRPEWLGGLTSIDPLH